LGIEKVEDYAKRLGVSRQTIYNKIKSGALKTQMIDNVIYVEYFDSQEEKEKEIKEILETMQKEINCISSICKELKEENQELKELIQKLLEKEPKKKGLFR
jgi:predicted DNA-binding transcriptional regulator